MQSINRDHGVINRIESDTWAELCCAVLICADMVCADLMGTHHSFRSEAMPESIAGPACLSSLKSMYVYFDGYG